MLNKGTYSRMIGIMDRLTSFSSFKDLSVYCVGIKGTGMAAIAELLHGLGARVRGSDREEQFYTDLVLKELKIQYTEGFKKENVPADVDMMVHSAAYSVKNNPEVREGFERGLPVLTYPEALGFISSLSESTGIAGTHGKTTTAALCGTILKRSGIPGSVLVGSAVSNLGGRSTYSGGKKYFIAETCEYRRHFLHFHPSRLVITNIEPDHLDYFSGYEDCIAAFTEYGGRLPPGGTLIYCSDDEGAVEAVKRITASRGDLELIPYGKSAPGPFGVTEVLQRPGKVEFSLNGFRRPFSLQVPGEHTVLNAAASSAITYLLGEKEGIPADVLEDTIRKAIGEFSGSSRRSEVLGEAGGILFMDDYGHHPTEIRTTISGIRRFYPGRRLIVDFMSHTFSRTKALFADFTTSFKDADEVIFHKIYGSAREEEDSGINGETLYRGAKQYVKHARYYPEVPDAKDYLLSHLREGDIFLTLGAGDNWRLGKEIYESLLNPTEKEGKP